MATLDMIFAKEFYATCQQRKAISGALNLQSIPVPSSIMNINKLSKNFYKVRLRGISEQYFNELNNSDAYLWTKPKLSRRRFSSDGKFIKDEFNNYVTDDVTLPHECCAILSSKRIGVPLKFKSKEGFDFVDFIKVDDKIYFIYIIPKNYCYKISELALVLSFTRLRSFYSSLEVKTLSGHSVFVSVIPYNISRMTNSNYRVLCLKTVKDFSDCWEQLYKYWVSKGVSYPRELCELSEPIKGQMNVGYCELNPTLEDYQIYNPQKSLANTENDIDNLEG